MFAFTLPRFALAALSLAFGAAQAQTPRIGEPAPSASKTKKTNPRLTPKTKAKAKVVRPDARRGKDLRATPKGQTVNVKSPRQTITRPAAAPASTTLRRGPTGRTVNVVTPRKRVSRGAPSRNLRAAPGTTVAPRTVDAELRDCAPGDSRLKCRQEIIRRR